MRRILSGFLRFWRLMPVYWSLVGRCHSCGCRRFWMFADHDVCEDCHCAYEICLGNFIKRAHLDLPPFVRSDAAHLIKCGENHWPGYPRRKGVR